MRFTVRAGKDPVTRADGTILSAMGLPGGGVISVGKTHALVRAGDVSEPTALLLGPRVLDNAGLYLGQGIDAKRVILPTAERVVVAGGELPLEAKAIARALQGIPVSVGDVVAETSMPLFFILSDSASMNSFSSSTKRTFSFICHPPFAEN